MKLTDFSGAGIKSVKRGTTPVAQNGAGVDVTILPVDLTKSVVLVDFTYSSASNGVMATAAASLTAANTLTCYARGNDPGANVTVYWQVIEYK